MHDTPTPTESHRLLFSQDDAIRTMGNAPYLLVAQEDANALADIVDAACDLSRPFVGDPSAPVLPDALVDELMRGLQVQIDRETVRLTGSGKGKDCHICKGIHATAIQYARDLPRPRQRALAERLYGFYRRWVEAGNTMPVYREGQRAPRPASQPWYGDG